MTDPCILHKKTADPCKSVETACLRLMDFAMEEGHYVALTTKDERTATRIKKYIVEVQVKV